MTGTTTLQAEFELLAGDEPVRTTLDQWVRAAGKGERWDRGYRVFRHPDGHYEFRKKSEGLGDLAEPHPQLRVDVDATRLRVTAKPSGSWWGTLIGIGIGVATGLLMAVYSTRGEINLSFELLLAVIGLPLLVSGGMWIWNGRLLKQNSKAVVQRLAASLQLSPTDT